MHRSLAALLLAAALPAAAQKPSAPFRVELEAGAAKAAYNNVRLPGNTGSSVNFAALQGRGEIPFSRVTLTWQPNSRDTWRFLYAPLSAVGTGTLSSAVQFGGASFAAGAAEATYRFNSYRVSYRRQMVRKGRTDLAGGLTLKVRDAEIALRQGLQHRSDSDVGVVPLFHLAGEYQLRDRWSLLMDFDGSAAPMGRAFDLGIRMAYRVSPQWRVTAGYRMLEGGVDIDRVYNFAMFNYLSLGMELRF